LTLAMSSYPLVSVIIPTYNRKAFLIEALHSVFKQTYGNLEIIVVDDGSDDNTKEGLKEFLKHPNFKYLFIRHNGHPGAVRNRGVLEASGEYIAFLDSDDLWKEQKTEKQINFMLKRPDTAVCHTREEWIRRGRTVSQAGQRHKKEGYIFKDALKKCIIGPSTVMIKHSVLDECGGFNEELEIAEDYEMWLRLTALYSIGYIDIPLVVKRGGHSDQLSEKYGYIEYFRIKALQNVIDLRFFSKEQRVQVLRELSRKCRIYANGCIKRGKLKEGEKYNKLALNYSGKAGKDNAGIY